MKKFKIGDIVRHKATRVVEGTRMVVIGVGSMNYDTTEMAIYHVTGERQMWGRPAGEPIYSGAYVSELELVLADFDESINNSRQ